MNPSALEKVRTGGESMPFGCERAAEAVRGTVAPLRATPGVRCRPEAVPTDVVDSLGVESALDTERAARSTVAGNAVADRDANAEPADAAKSPAGTDARLLWKRHCPACSH